MISNDYQTTITEFQNSHLTITLNRPEKRNAINDEMVRELKIIFSKAAKDETIRTISLEANGPAFCSGADLNYLKELKSFDEEKNLQDSLSLSELFLLVYEHPKPVIALINGPALAGGCGLASVCDFIIASKNAKFGYPEVKIGFIASIVSVFLIRQIGERKARDLLLTGKIISADEAANLGLINEVIEEKHLEQRKSELIQNLQDNSPMAISATKKLLDSFNFSNLAEEVRKKAIFNTEFRKTPDFIEGISSFLEKRTPEWIKHK